MAEFLTKATLGGKPEVILLHIMQNGERYRTLE